MKLSENVEVPARKGISAPKTRSLFAHARQIRLVWAVATVAMVPFNNLHTAKAAATTEKQSTSPLIVNTDMGTRAMRPRSAGQPPRKSSPSVDWAGDFRPTSQLPNRCLRLAWPSKDATHHAHTRDT